MDRVDKLLAAMTVEEKIGQLNMAAAGFAVTGPVLASKATEDISAGHFGSLSNFGGSGRARERGKLQWRSSSQVGGCFLISEATRIVGALAAVYMMFLFVPLAWT